MASGKNLKKALKVNDLTHEMAADLLNISRGTLNNYFKKDELEEEIVQNVQDKLGIDLNAPTIPYTQQRFEKKINQDDIYLVPFVDIPAQAGYTKAYMQRDYIESLKKFPILPDVEPQGAIWRYFQIEGYSMENPNPKPGEDEGLRHGDTILCSQVPKEDWSTFSNLYTYVVVTDDEMWIKDVDREMFAKHQKWVLLSRNEEYDPFLVDIKDVRQLWIMRRHIRNRAKKHRMYDLKAIKEILNNGLEKPR